MATTNDPPRIVQICRMENVNSETLLALGSDGLVYERKWSKNRQRFSWFTRHDPLPATPDFG